MSEEQPQAAKRSRKLYVLWAVALTLLLSTALFCWLVAVPVWQVRTFVVHGTLENTEVGESTVLGSPEETAARLENFVRMPDWVTHTAPDDAGLEFDLRLTAIELLRDLGPVATDSLTRLLDHEDEMVRATAAHQFCAIGPELNPDAGKVVPALLRLMKIKPTYEAHHARSKAAAALGAVGAEPDKVVPVLAQALKDKDAEVRANAVTTLFRFGPAARAAVPELTAALGDKVESIREIAVRTLGRIGPPAKSATMQLAARMLEEERYYPRQCAADALGCIGPGAKEAIPALIKALEDKNHAVRHSAATALGKMGSHAQSAIPALRRASADGISGLSARQALEKIRAAEAQKKK